MKPLIILFLLFISCGANQKKQMGKWKSIKGTGLKEVNEHFNKMLFTTDETGFLFGNNCTDDIILNNRFDEFNAVGYKTKDGGLNWSEKQICKGNIEDACSIHDTVYALSTRPSKDYVGKTDTSHIFVSYDKGESWIKKFTLTYPNVIYEIKFMNSNIGIAITGNKEAKNQNVTVLITYDGGAKWDKFVELPNLISPLLYNDSLWYLSEDQGRYSLTKENIHDKKFNIETLPIGFKPEKLEFGSEGDFWLVGKQDDKLVLYRRDEKGNYFNVKEFDDKHFFYSYVNVYKNHVTLIAGKIVSSIVVYKVFLSYDYGKTWSEEEPPISTYVKPVAFFQDKLWIYSGAGRIQLRE